MWNFLPRVGPGKVPFISEEEMRICLQSLWILLGGKSKSFPVMSRGREDDFQETIERIFFGVHLLGGDDCLGNSFDCGRCFFEKSGHQYPPWQRVNPYFSGPPVPGHAGRVAGSMVVCPSPGDDPHLPNADSPLKFPPDDSEKTYRDCVIGVTRVTSDG